jgi:hypothetical protein
MKNDGRIEEDFKGNDRGLTKILYPHLPRGNEENHEKSVRTAGDSAEEHIPNKVQSFSARPTYKVPCWYEIQKPREHITSVHA